ncbi:S8 family serine peptidase [Kitasatospora sp. NBC_00240]|uniref:S8 family serine peptidase n=1 Tax=Kitasatospora sp. NBC_00240 TaxID=2903567 RepID=UPI002256F4F5|nr:S8 family serine peptidase [Kitasatospora sp. NBC_00240]MCX5211455.1 S8 family serine peptidase [Kitasatospora sp. NBC_00240]
MAGPLELVGLSSVMARSAGRSEVVVGLIDGPVAVGHPGLAGRRVVVLPGGGGGTRAGACDVADGGASCLHGTFVAGVLSGRRSSGAPGVCPGCTLLVRPIFAGDGPGRRTGPAARLEDLAAAVVECVDAGARVLNLSAAPERPSSAGNRELEGALDHAAAHGVITVVAAGNQGALGSSAIVRHPWAVPVVAYDRRGRPMDLSNLGGSIGGRGVGAPGEAVASLGPGGRPLVLTGTSAAAPFVAGTVALLLSEFPGATPAAVRAAVLASGRGPRRSVVPPLLDAGAARAGLLASYGRR